MPVLNLFMLTLRISIQEPSTMRLATIKNAADERNLRWLNIDTLRQDKETEWKHVVNGQTNEGIGIDHPV